MSKLAITFADELRARSDDDLASLFKLRPDLVTPVPNDFTALAARATSTPSLVRALDSLNLWHYQIIEAACVLAEPFKKSEIVSITSQESNFALDYLWQMGLLYKEGNNFRTPFNLKLLIGDEPIGLGPELGSKVDFSKLKDVPKSSAEVLSKLIWGPPRGQISNIKKPGTAIGWLLENNILVALDSNTVALPREYAIKLRGDKVHKELSSKPIKLTGKTVTQKQADLAAIANISTILRWCEEFLHNLSDEPPTALRTGGIGVRELKRIAEHLGVEENCVGFIAELCYLAGLVVIDPDDQILPTSSFDIWLSKPSEERWYSLVVLWLDTSRVSGLIGRGPDKNIAPLGPELDRAGASLIKRTTLKILFENLEVSPEIPSIKEIVKWWNPQRFNGDFVDWSLRDFLTKTSKTPMPQPLEYLITDVAKRHGKLRVGSAHAYIRCEDEGLIQQILHDKKCEHLRLRRIAPQVLATDFELPEVITELREYGYLPAAENASGILLSQPNLRRAKSRPKPPRIIVEFSAPKESVIASAVKTIRAGERSRKVEPIIPGTSSNETLALINQYINNQQTIAISYADNNGGVINRIIEPISISLGTLTAKDEASGEITQFRIPRINGVAPAFTISQNKADLDL
ncbi:MAG: hypothetical protein EBV61_00225 [Actinobacteria bacterium]|nr:hypothetical protein [Actinomycetota bacterium]